MTEQTQRTRRSAAAVRGTVAAAFAVLALASCGGGNDNPLDNPNTLSNPTLSGNQRLRFSYFQTCVFPLLLKPLPIRFANGATTINTCAASGCHDNANGTGGAFRVIPNAQPIDLSNTANTADIIRASDMYKNFYSAQGEVVFGSPLTSRILAKPMVNGVLHGGGLVFETAQDPDARLIQYWINNPSPSGTDEFGDPTFGFTPGPVCNSQ
jgi:hypothetical protein